MTLKLRHIQVLLSVVVPAVALMFTSCEVEGDREICDYNVELYYHYNRENTTQNNVLPSYVRTLTQYLFDSDGILLDATDVPVDVCEHQYITHRTLPPGRYSVIMWGNCGERNTVTDLATGGAPVEGQTHRDDMRLTHNNSMQQNGDRLWHGYRTFSVAPEGVSRIRVDAVHSHLVIKFRVRWKSNAPVSGTYIAWLEDIGSEKSFMPEYIYPQPDAACETHDRSTHDLYPQHSNNVVHHIPYVHHTTNVLDHRTEAPMGLDNALWGEFVTYRIRQDSHPILSIYDAGGNLILHPDPAKQIDLKRYFDEMGIDLDHTLRQEYEIDIVIDGDQVWLMALNVADWEDGGWLGI